MGNSPLKISLRSPQTYQINLNDTQAQIIGLGTPVAYGAAKLSIDTSAHWAERTTYIPKKGEIVVYSDRRTIDGINFPGIKIGDGLAYVVDLPFAGDDTADILMGIINEHIANMNIHITAEEREDWNNKVSCDIDGERLILERTDSDA